MAETFVSKDQFEEFTKRMEQGFDQINQRLSDLRAELKADSVSIQHEMRSNHANIQAQMNQVRNWLIGLYGIVVFGFIGSIFLTIIKQSTGAP